ncbi:TldD/PmbA family protein [Methanoculleus sp. FWC-SCC1]|uniref:TldD/PmbA family protein n=1 Tax=Methanoculleus frigidifontis TaxID=2584085 RepID=A0ABT8M9S7_9EURY|nr:TldD/PmbA family protein [Methanoculleus sp. FWC-SCC1]MDN7024693.1 TldD/PmbA family protein [Methanoculleus sp. FWC-SCC1]
MKGEYLIDDIIREGRHHADEVEVFYVRGSSISAEIKQSIIGAAEASREWAVAIRTIKDGRIGISSTSDPAKWRECLDAALASGRIATPQEWHGLPKPADIVSTAPSADRELVVDAGGAADLIARLLEGAAEYPVDVAGGGADLARSHLTIANSSGVLYGMERTSASVSLEAIREHSTGYEFAASPFTADIDPRSVGEQAAFLASHSVGGQEILTGRYDVVLSPIAAAQLIGTILVPALSGRNVKAGRSYLAGKLGEQCMDESLSIVDDPFARGMGSTCWDGEGVPTQQLDFVRDGELRCFAYDLKTAYRYGEDSTGSATRSGAGGAPAIGLHNLVVDGPRTRVDDERAIFVHTVVGAHTANPFSGDFSIEVSNAYWIEDGVAGDPIRTAMFAGNLFEMLRSVDGLGEDSRIVGRLILPSIRFNNQHIVGT